MFEHMHAPCFAKVLSLGDGHVSSICVMDWETKDSFQFCHPQCFCISTGKAIFLPEIQTLISLPYGFMHKKVD